jgi:hypothetical protein
MHIGMAGACSIGRGQGRADQVSGPSDTDFLNGMFSLAERSMSAYQLTD